MGLNTRPSSRSSRPNSPPPPSSLSTLHSRHSSFDLGCDTGFSGLLSGKSAFQFFCSDGFQIQRLPTTQTQHVGQSMSTKTA
ncbi:hypothetical protein EV2_023416 [Malus domestica]